MSNPKIDKQFFKDGDNVYIRHQGGLIKRIFVEPYNAEHFVGKDYWGDNYLYRWELIYGTGDVEDKWRVSKDDMWMYEV